MCALCETLLTYSGSTTSLRCHLRASHPGDYRKVEETSSNAPSTPSRSDVGARPSRLRKRDTPSNQFETDSDLSEVLVKMNALELLLSKQLLPKKDAKSDVWNFFGFKTDPDDESKILDHSKVVCALCETLLPFSGNTTNLRSHLQTRHGTGPSKLRKRKTPSSRSKTESDLSVKVSVKMDASPVSELLRSKHLLSKKKPKSDVWNFFGFKTDPDDETKVLNRCEVVCALCEILLPYSGNTTNLRCHLITRHPGDYTEVQGTLSNAPSTPCSDVGAGPSKLRERKTLSSQSKTDSDLCEVSVKMDAFPVSELLRSKQLLQRKGAKSDVWNFFGFKMDPDDESEILDHSKVICALCERQLCYNGVSTTMLRNHLRVRHPGDFLKVQDAPSNAPSTHSNSDVGAFPSRLKTKKTPSSQLKTDSDLSEVSVKVDAFELMSSKHLLKKKKSKSDVWKFFGFKTDPEDETKVLDHSKVMCALCEILLPFSGNTTNLRCHLQARHPSDYCEVQDASSNAPSTPSRTDDGAGPSKLGKTKTPSSRSKTDSDLSEVSVEMDALEFLRSKHLLPDKDEKSDIRNFFWFKTDPDDESKILNHSKVMCALCERLVPFSGSTTNLKGHLQSRHPGDYRRIKDTSSIAQSTPSCPDVGAHPSKMRKRKLPSSQSKTDSDLSEVSVNMDALELLRSKHLLSKKKPKSDVWNFFGFKTDPDDETKILDHSEVMCALCEILLPYSGNTTNLRYHLKARHPGEYSEVQGTVSHAPSMPCSDVGAGPSKLRERKTPSSQSKTDSFVIEEDQYEAGSTKAKELTKAVAYHLARDMKPIYTVMESGFVQMLKTFDSRYVLPSRKEFSTTIIPDMYKELCSTTVRPFTESAEAYAMTTDLWMARNMTKFLGITFHAIDDDWDLKTYTIGNMECPPPHSADQIASSLKSILKEWNLTESRLSTVTTDKTPSMVKAVNDLGWGHLPCFGHFLNSVVKAGLETNQVYTTLTRCSKLVDMVRKSSNASLLLTKKQKMLDLPQNELIQAVETRWNSTLNMLTRFVEQQQAICAMLLELEHHELMPSSLELKTVEQLVTLLKPMKDMIEFLSGSDVTISGLFPCLYCLEKNLLKNEADTWALGFVKRAMAEKLGEVYKDRYVEERLHLCSFLDPRLKTMPFVEDRSIVEGVHELVSLTLTKMAEALPFDSPDQQGDDDVSEAPSKTSRITSLFGDMYSSIVTQMNPEAMAKDEVLRYIREPSLTLEEDPLKWWKMNEHRFKLLARAAREYLCIPVTSVPTERLFSTAGDIVSSKRACLKPSHVDHLTFLHDNLE
ncbi:zinc finger BED domain-containing protein 4-like isoform X1 [Asterias rubens]|uniref:zinc finger BED domain-containing protein 4-like isoform X1 n=1 Tax=Asterias rubens TaxID=7604 RepID=UPI0014551E4C|nr:zinc finger BED domain-containing protein 4-like isoform X1 [Asterias rubens]